MDKTQLENTIKEFLTYVQADAEFSVEPLEENFYDIQIDGPELNFLIGYHGKTLESFQHLVNLFLYNQNEDGAYVSLDINGYKEQRKEKLQEITKKYIDKARFFDKEVHMAPMSAWERKQVHLFVGEYPDIENESEGMGDSRHVVLSKKK